MKTQYITVTDNLKIDVKLEEDVEEVEEVVVTGYQTINKRRSTSAISSVKAEDILVPGMTSIDQALEGRIPDLQLMLNSGEVGATPPYSCSRNLHTFRKQKPVMGLGRVRVIRPGECKPGRLEQS